MISTVEPVADKISLASESKSLLVLEEWINKLCDLYQISVEQYGNVLIAITEAVNNAIIHGNKNIANKKTDIEYNIDSQTITFTCLLYTSPSPRDRQKSRMPSSA